MRAYKSIYVAMMFAAIALLVIDAIETISSQNLYGEAGTVMERYSYSLAVSDLIIVISLLLTIFWKRVAVLLSMAVPFSWLMYSYINVGEFMVVPHFIWVPLVAGILVITSWWLFEKQFVVHMEANKMLEEDADNNSASQRSVKYDKEMF